MKTPELNEESLIDQIAYLSGKEWTNICHPQSHEERILRRASVWAFSQFLSLEPNGLCKRFNIQAQQSVRRILKNKNLPEDEYNWRILIRKRIRLEEKTAAA